MFEVILKKCLEKDLLTETEVLRLVIRSREVFLLQPMLLDVSAPIAVCGDIHGQFSDLVKIFERVGPESSYLFLGDYVDRGAHSLPTICLLLCYKIMFPDRIFLLRGNHECASVTRMYGFYDDCKRQYSVKVWKAFTDTFNCMPIAALIDGKIFCMHGGLSLELTQFSDISRITRPMEVPDSGLVCDLLWADPSDVSNAKGGGYSDNERGVSFCFGPDVVVEFCAKHGVDLICRGHQCVQEGYQFFSGTSRQLVTIFSAPNYCGEFDNAGAVLLMDADGKCSFEIFRHVVVSRTPHVPVVQTPIVSLSEEEAQLRIKLRSALGDEQRYAAACNITMWRFNQ